MHVRFARAAALLMVALVAGGCTKSLDTSSLETTLQSQAATQLGLDDLTVSCPDNVKVESGATFDCTATSADAGFTLTVTQTDEQGTVTWKVVDASSTSSSTPSPAS